MVKGPKPQDIVENECSHTICCIIWNILKIPVRREYGERIKSRKLDSWSVGKEKRMYEDTNKLIVWQRSHELVLKIYKITKDFPKDEQFGLTSQIRRASASVPSNIVEGKARCSNKEYKRFLLIARGSLEETKYQLLLAKDLKYIDENIYREIYKNMDEVGKLLGGLIKKLGV